MKYGLRTPNMNKNIEPGKTLYDLREGMGYFEARCFKSRVQGNAANVLANLQGVLDLAPDIPVSARNLLASGFSFRLRLVVASGRRGGRGV